MLRCPGVVLLDCCCWPADAGTLLLDCWCAVASVLLRKASASACLLNVHNLLLLLLLLPLSASRILEPWSLLLLLLPSGTTQSLLLPRPDDAADADADAAAADDDAADAARQLSVCIALCP